MNRINKLVRIILNVIYGIIIVAFTVTMEITPYDIVITTLIDIGCIIAIVLNSITLKKDPYNSKFKTISLNGFLIEYAIILFLSVNDYVFTFAYVIISMYILYFDLQLIKNAVITFNALNIMFVIKCLIVGHMPSGAPNDITLFCSQVAFMLFFGRVTYIVTKKSNETNKTKLDVMEEQKNKTDEILKTVIAMLEKIKSNIDTGTTMINDLNQMSGTSKEMIAKTDTINNDTFISVGKQTELNKDAKSFITDIETDIKSIIDTAKSVAREITTSNKKMEELEYSAQEITSYNEKVLEAINRFIKKTEIVKNIATGIVDISSQTNSLAVCAAIESARAGESGKGFLVVSDEIRNLADQTKELTNDVTKVISFLEENVKETSEVVLQTVQSIYSENKIINDVKRYFDILTININELDKDMNAILNSTYEMIDFNDGLEKHISQLNLSSEDLTKVYSDAILSNKEYDKKINDAKDNMDKLLVSAEEIEQYI